MTLKKSASVLLVYVFFGGLGALVGYASGYSWGTDSFGECLLIGLAMGTICTLPILAGDRK